MTPLATTCFAMALLGGAVLVLTAERRRLLALAGMSLIAIATWVFPAGPWWVQ
jgi:hypothetical protein